MNGQDEENVVVGFQVTSTLKKRMEEKAAKLGLNLSNYLRYAVMKELESGA